MCLQSKECTMLIELVHENKLEVCIEKKDVIMLREMYSVELFGLL